MKRILNNKKVLIPVIIFVVLLLCGIGFYNYRNKDNENKTFNALIAIDKQGVTLQTVNIYKKSDTSSRVLYQISKGESFSVISDADYTDDTGKVFTKILYHAPNNKRYSGYVEKAKIRIVDLDDNDDDVDVEPVAPSQFTVSFDSDGGSPIDFQVVKVGGKALKPSDPRKTGYKFSGWELDGKEYDFNLVVDKNINLKASWTPIKYTVTFDSDRGTPISKQEVAYGRLVNKPSNPKKAGNKFVSWTLDGSDYNFNSKVTNDIELVATYKPSFSNIDNCSSTTPLLTVNGDKRNSYSLYRCVADYHRDYTADGKDTDCTYNTRMSQNIAVTQDYVYVSYPINGGWSTDINSLSTISTNLVHRINKKTSELATMKINYGGHGQSFDSQSASKDLLYYNAYPYMSYSETMQKYGAHSLGFAYGYFSTNSNTSVNKSPYISPSRATILSNGQYLTSYSGSNYNINNINSAIKLAGTKNQDRRNYQIAVDGKYKRVAFISGSHLYLHDLTKLKSNDSKKYTKSLLATFTNDDFKSTQGFELYGDYFFFWKDVLDKDENGKSVRTGNFELLVYKFEKTTNENKIVYNVSKYNEINIDLSDYYNSSNKKTEILTDSKTKKSYESLSCEAEGMAIFDGNIYLAVSCREDNDSTCKSGKNDYKKIANLDIYQLNKN